MWCNMEFDIDMGGMISSIEGKSRKEILDLAKSAMSEIGKNWEAEAKRIVSDISDTGEFEDSISHEMFMEGTDIGFEGTDGVDYGVRFEFGDEEVPELKSFVNAMIKVQGESEEIFARVFGDNL